MKTIHKYQLNVGFNSIGLFNGFKILKAAEQHGMLCIWVLHDPAEYQVMINFEVHPTGYQLDYYDTSKYIDSIVMQCGEV